MPPAMSCPLSVPGGRIEYPRALLLVLWSPPSAMDYRRGTKTWRPDATARDDVRLRVESNHGKAFANRQW